VEAKRLRFLDEREVFDRVGGIGAGTGRRSWRRRQNPNSLVASDVCVDTPAVRASSSIRSPGQPPVFSMISATSSALSWPDTSAVITSAVV
jgi:hypothetical protein